MIVLRSRTFDKEISKVSAAIYRAFDQRIALFIHDPFHPLLNNHALTGIYQGYRSINITGDWRVMYQQVEIDVVRLMRIGTHPQLYE